MAADSEMTRTASARVSAAKADAGAHRNRLRHRVRRDIGSGQEKRDVYRVAIGWSAWVREQVETRIGVHSHARNPWPRAIRSMPLRIAEGNRKTAAAGRRRFLEIARGSAPECAAVQAVLVVGTALDETDSRRNAARVDPRDGSAPVPRAAANRPCIRVNEQRGRIGDHAIAQGLEYRTVMCPSSTPMAS